MKRLSIKLKVTLWYSLVVLVISAIAVFLMMQVSQKVLINDSSVRLKHSIDGMANFFTETKRDYRKTPGFRFFNNGVHTAIYGENGDVIDGIMPFEFVLDVKLCEDKIILKKYDGESFLTYSRKITANTGENVWVAGVISVANEARMIQSVGKTNLILALIMVLTASIGGYFIIKRALKPVGIIAKTAKRISESSDLSQRISLGNGKDEIYKLAEVFDEMLAKIEKTFENEKQFTQDASHELRTPIAVIGTECEYGLNFAKNFDEAKESLMSIKRQSDKMSKLVSNLLKISRMDRNTLKLEQENLNLSELVGFICDEQEEINTKKIVLNRDIDENIYIYADRLLITGMFMNLISNAYTYGKENGNIWVSVKKENNKTVVKIKDDGIGISEENLSKIWDRFFQADASRTAKESVHQGLGLSMVKWIAEKHGGNIYAESKLSSGSTFTFII